MLRNSHIATEYRQNFYARIGRNETWFGYYLNYRYLVDNIVSQIEKGITPIDIVSTPLMFLIRHSLELGLKANILELEMINNSVEKIKLGGKNSHSIQMLFDKFKTHMTIIITSFEIPTSIKKEIEKYLEKFKLLTAKFTQIDNGSFNFRYPIDTKGNYNFEWEYEEDIAKILDIYYDIIDLLNYTVDVLTDVGIIKE